MITGYGAKPPLHRRFNEGAAIEYVRNRYRHMRQQITNQVHMLQQDPSFCRRCQEYYARGYPDWVILSACNTAAGDASGAQALSGLARAFIYAQARALLVSHWAVESGATVKLITSAMGEMSRDPGAGRAEALRRAMLALIDKGVPEESHPSYWAPFVVVGEGAR